MGGVGRGEEESVGEVWASVLGCGEVGGKVENVGRGVDVWQRCGGGLQMCGRREGGGGVGKCGERCRGRSVEVSWGTSR